MKWFVLSATGLLALFGCSTSSDNGSPSATTDEGAAETLNFHEDNCVGTMPFDAWVADPRMCVFVFASDLTRPRQIAIAHNGDLFVSDKGKITALWDDDHNGHSDAGERATFATADGLNHGVAFSPDHAFLYASSDTTVFRWAFHRGDRVARGPAEIVVKNMPAAGRHPARTLVFDRRGRLYVNIGSGTNVDDTQELFDTRAQIRRFSIPDSIPAGGIDYAKGEIAASGMRNENGIFVDRHDRLWGVENGADDLFDPRFGGDIHNDNPGEEINLVEVDDEDATKFYGYPFCYSEFKLPNGGGPGTQWADQVLEPDHVKTEAFCRNPRMVHAPMFVMQPHWAPLGIIQYTGHSLPFIDDFVIAVHGSFDRQPAVGKLLALAKLRHGHIVSVEPIVGAKNAAGGLEQGQANAPRPVDVRQGPDGAIYYSDDTGKRIFKLGFRR